MHSFTTAMVLVTEQLTHDLKKITLRVDDLEPFIPGQFYIVKAPSRSNDHFEREYSISNNIKSKYIELCVQLVEGGVVSTYLHNLKRGEEVDIKGPIGKYFNFEPREDTSITLVAGGAGIVPYMSMLRSYPNQKFNLIASFRKKEDIPFFEELNQYKNTSTLITLTREKWNGSTGRITKNMFKDVNKNSLFYICGRTSFVEDIYKLVLELGVKEENIRKERFG